MSDAAKNFNRIHHTIKVFSIPIAILIISGLSFMLFAGSEKPISSGLIASFIFVSYYLITYLYLCPYLFNRDSILTLFFIIIFFALLAGFLFMTMLKLNILAYPRPYDTHPTNDTYIFSIILVCSIAVLLGATNTYLILNTFRLSADSYQLLQKSYQSEISALRLQMNPHYISNSLNNLNHTIRKGDLSEAIKYNDELIELLEEQMRYINTETISLNDELSWLEYYFDMEQRRLKYQFAVQVNVEDPALYNFTIPPMLFQPIIENSIIHGFNPEIYKGNGTISISVNKVNRKAIRIFIADNGVGSNAIEQFNKKRPSISTQNIYKRIQLINEIGRFHITIHKEINTKGTNYQLLITDNFLS